MECRTGCGACCIGLSISSPIPGMPEGKPANIPCIHLDASFRCKIFHHPDRPKVCAQLKPREDMCFSHRDEALRYLQQLEILTSP
ncbi:YkgJ family cysteine cluster protein [Jinshanibacter sp. LJY008]|uniref:YkgJ family cysteine cluster protein n=1 Tax=Limnobaculum eriocheiris TaxID=2897391 RepID=A0A9X1MVM3_9GAMM|nr:YkgJ family cysteine cluster protein [Limnobaculum eriocheiris]MCD1124587.1 YkgJ family cysteine cluster protein [Limnobaculum eriocheiris]